MNFFCSRRGAHHSMSGLAVARLWLRMVVGVFCLCALLILIPSARAEMIEAIEPSNPSVEAEASPFGQNELPSGNGNVQDEVYQQSNIPHVEDATYGAVDTVYQSPSQQVYEQSYVPVSNLNPVLPALSSAVNGFLVEEKHSTGYHYIVSASSGAYKAEGFLQLPKSFFVNKHGRFPTTMNNDVPYFFFGIYTGRGGLDVGICWQKTPDNPDGGWYSFVTVFPRNGRFYTHKEGKEIPGLKNGDVLHMTAIQYDDGVRMELRRADKNGAMGELLLETDFDIPGLALRADGRGSFFNREISLAQHVIDYTNGAEMIEASWWGAKLHWRNYSTAWDSRVVNLTRTRWEPVSEKRVLLFEQSLYDGEKVSFAYRNIVGQLQAGR